MYILKEFRNKYIYLKETEQKQSLQWVCLFMFGGVKCLFGHVLGVHDISKYYMGLIENINK